MHLKAEEATSNSVEGLRYITSLKTQVAELVSELERAETNYERERARADKIAAELMVSKEVVTRLEGELIALKARSFWERLFNYT